MRGGLWNVADGLFPSGCVARLSKGGGFTPTLPHRTSYPAAVNQAADGFVAPSTSEAGDRCKGPTGVGITDILLDFARVHRLVLKGVFSR